MARRPSGPSSGDESTPREYAQTPPPRDLHPTSDIRFVIHEIGNLTAKVDRLIEDTKSGSDKISELAKKVSNFEVAAKCIGAAVVLVSIVFWWVFGEHVRTIVNSSIRSAIMESSKGPTVPPAANSPSTPSIPGATAPPKLP